MFHVRSHVEEDTIFLSKHQTNDIFLEDKTKRDIQYPQSFSADFEDRKSSHWKPLRQNHQTTDLFYPYSYTNDAVLPLFQLLNFSFDPKFENEAIQTCQATISFLYQNQFVHLCQNLDNDSPTKINQYFVFMSIVGYVLQAPMVLVPDRLGYRSQVIQNRRFHSMEKHRDDTFDMH